MSALTVGLVGAGGITYAHTPSWLALGHDVIVHAEAGAAELAAHFGLTVVDSLDELLDRAAVVDICTPTYTHAEIARRAIERGIPVFCEKPVARTVEDARQLAHLAAERGVPIFPAHVVRYFPEYVAVRAAVQAGRIGDLAVLRFTRGGPAPVSDWFFDVEASGGLVLDQMIHDLDQARWIAGEVVRVMAVQNPPIVDGVTPALAVAHVTLTHASGALSHVQGSWGPAGVEFVTSFDISGSGGRLQYDSQARREVVANVPPGGSAGSYLPEFGTDNPYAAEMADFVASIGTGAPTSVTIVDGIIAVGIAEAAQESMRVGAPVAVDEALWTEGIGA